MSFDGRISPLSPDRVSPFQGSRNWYKLKDKLAKLHYRIRCIRHDAQHKTSTAIINNASCISIESLNVAGMLKNHRLARALSDASLSSFLEMLKNKAERINVKMVDADTFYPLSKTCSACGSVDSDLSLSDRTYHCSVCDHTQDRDLERLNACGDTVRPHQLGQESLKQEDSTEQQLLVSLS